MLFPVIIYDDKTPLPEDENIFYVITKNGNYLYKNLNTVKSMTKVDSISFLNELEGFAELKIPLIPKEIIAEAITYLQYIYNKCHSEGGLILHLFPETGKYELHCPTQKVSSSSVNWDNEKEQIPQGAIRICSIHSHASSSAFHSCIDKDDEKNFDGIHITFGHMNEKINSIVASIVVNGNRFKLDEDKISKYIEIDIIPIENTIKVDQSKQYIKSSMYEDYQSTLGNHNSQDITLSKLEKWNGYTNNNGCVNDERKFTLNVESSAYNFPDIWKTKFEYKTPKFYRWDKKIGRIIEIKSDYYKKYKYNNYDMSKWNDYLDDTPTYPLMYNPYYPKDNVKYLPKPKETCDLFPKTGNCNRCIYKKLAKYAVNQGFLETEDKIDYTENEIEDLESIIDDNYFDRHTNEEEDLNKYDLMYDEKGNMVDSKDNVITVSEEEEKEDNHINSILSSKDIIDHK